MRGNFQEVSLLLALLALVAASGGVLIWLAPVPAEQVTPAQNRLIEAADTMLKGASGAIIGFLGARRYLPGNGGRSNPPT